MTLSAQIPQLNAHDIRMMTPSAFILDICLRILGPNPRLCLEGGEVGQMDCGKRDVSVLCFEIVL